MGIAEIIQRKKEQFFVARDSDKLELQKQHLLAQRDASKAERAKVEEVRQLQNEISTNQRAINEGRSSGVAGRVASGFKAFQKGVQKVQQQGEKMGPQNNNSPFYTGGIMERTAKPAKKTEGKTVVIRIGK